MTLVDASPGRHCSTFTTGAGLSVGMIVLLTAGCGRDDCWIYDAEKLCNLSSIWSSPESLLLALSVLCCSKLCFLMRFMAVA
jgi:hypothetical protein